MKLKNMNSKTKRQLVAIERWHSNNCIGCFQHTMRFGKTREILMVCRDYREVQETSRIIVIVPTEIAYANLNKVLKPYNVELYSIRQFMSKNKDFLKVNCGLLIIDEIHALIKPKYISVIKQISARCKLGLTGANLTSQQKSELRMMGFPLIDVITEEEAKFNKWIVEFDEYNIALSIDERDKLNLRNITHRINDISQSFQGLKDMLNNAYKRNIFSSTFDLIQSCVVDKGIQDPNTFKIVETIESKKIRQLCSLYRGFRPDMVVTNDVEKKIKEYWNFDNVQKISSEYIRLIRDRNAFFKYNRYKIEAVLKLSNIFDIPTIVYNDSIPMIDHLYDCMKASKVRYHSGLEPIPMIDETGEPICYKSGSRKGEQKILGLAGQKTLAIKAISEGRVNYLLTGKSLNESLNLPNIKQIICTSGDTNPNTYDQRVARGKTVNDVDSSKRCRIINLVIDDFFYDDVFVSSRDKEKLIIRQENVKDVIWFENLDDFLASIK